MANYKIMSFSLGAGDRDIEEFLADLPSVGGRSKFIRDAIREKALTVLSDDKLESRLSQMEAVLGQIKSMLESGQFSPSPGAPEADEKKAIIMGLLEQVKEL